MKKSFKTLLIISLVLLLALSAAAFIACKKSHTPKLLVSYSGTVEIKLGDSLDSIKPLITVTYVDGQGNRAVVDDYSVHGAPVEGKTTLTITYKELTATIEINVLPAMTQEERRGLEYELNPDGNSYILASADNCKDENIVIHATYAGKPVTKIGAVFARRSDIKSVVIPDSVESINGYAFDMCSNLETVTLGKGVKSIGYCAFEGCGNLVNLYYTGTLSDWCDINFEGVLSNPAGVAYNLYVNNRLINGALVIPNDVTAIKQYAFEGYNKITSVTIGNGVTSIGDDAFSGCKGLTSVTIGNNVQTVGALAFSDCYELSGVSLGNGVKTIDKRAFEACSKLTSIVIPNSVTTIGDEAFKSTGLTNVTLGGGVTSIGSSAFYNCDSLSKVNYLGTVEDWCNIEFGNSVSNPVCYSKNLYFNNVLLTELVIPDTVNVIRDNAFYCCQSITKIVFSSSVTDLRQYCFHGCGNVAEIRYDGTTEQWSTVKRNYSYLDSGAAKYVICSNGNVNL